MVLTPSQKCVTIRLHSAEYLPIIAVRDRRKNMMKSGLSKRIISAILVLVMVIGMCPIQAFAARDTGSVSGSNGGKLHFTKVEGINADVMHPSTKVNQEKEESPYDDADIVRVSIVLSKEPTLEKFSTLGIAANNAAMVYRQGLQVEQEEIAEMMDMICRANGITMEQLQEYYDAAMEQAIIKSILTGKAVQLIRDTANVTVVDK